MFALFLSLFITFYQIQNSETRDEMSYEGGPRTKFQRFIRLPKEGL